jgi:hypothetical protein
MPDKVSGTFASATPVGNAGGRRVLPAGPLLFGVAGPGIGNVVKFARVPVLHPQ